MYSEKNIQIINSSINPTKKDLLKNLSSPTASDIRREIVFQTEEGRFVGHLNSLIREDNSGKNFCFTGVFESPDTKRTLLGGYYNTKSREGFIHVVENP